MHKQLKLRGHEVVRMFVVNDTFSCIITLGIRCMPKYKMHSKWNAFLTFLSNMSIFPNGDKCWLFSVYLPDIFSDSQFCF